MAFPPSLCPSRLMDQNFGMCITPNDFLLPFYNYSTNYYRPWWKWNTQNIAKDFGSTISNERESFKVTLDVQHFRPNELSVKVANNQIIVEGRHEERQDEHSFVSRQFTRRYALPNSCKPEDVISNLSSDGVLIIVANKSKELPKNEKNVPIQLCKSCPQREGAVLKTKTDQKASSAEIKAVDAGKKNTQIILKEDHCCLLLKPELLREAASDSTEVTVEKKKDRVEQENLKACPGGKNTSEMLEQTFAKSNVTTSSALGEKCDTRKISKSEEIGQKKAKSSTAMSASDENFDLFDKTSVAMSTSDTKFDQTYEKSSAGMSQLSEKVGQSKTIKSEMSELSSMSSKTSESIECSTSYQASMTSNIKELSEEISDFVSDILCSELDKTLDLKK